MARPKKIIANDEPVEVRNFCSAGFWLPVGKANFYRDNEDGSLANKMETNADIPSSVFNRLRIRTHEVESTGSGEKKLSL